jgi:hypothetical protein
VERQQVFADSVAVLVPNQLRPGADDSRSQAELALSRIQLIQAEQSEQVARAALAQWLGVAPGDIQIAADPLLEPPGRPATAAPPASHPLAETQMASVESSRALQQVLDRSFFPRVSAQAAYALRGTGAVRRGHLRRLKVAESGAKRARNPVHSSYRPFAIATPTSLASVAVSHTAHAAAQDGVPCCRSTDSLEPGFVSIADAIDECGPLIVGGQSHAAKGAGRAVHLEPPRRASTGGGRTAVIDAGTHRLGVLQEGEGTSRLTSDEGMKPAAGDYDAELLGVIQVRAALGHPCDELADDLAGRPGKDYRLPRGILAVVALLSHQQPPGGPIADCTGQHGQCPPGDHVLLRAGRQTAERDRSARHCRCVGWGHAHAELGCESRIGRRLAGSYGNGGTFRR